MKKLLFIPVFLFVLVGGAQSVKEIQEEIDRQVWKPFKTAFEALDAQALNSIYAEQVLRVTPNGIDTNNVFRAKNVTRFEESKSKGISIALDFWFDSRHTNETTSYEVGFYRIGFTDKDKTTTYAHGQFHIVVQKIEELWKITQDWDTTTLGGKEIDATDFSRQQAIQF